MKFSTQALKDFATELAIQMYHPNNTPEDTEKCEDWIAKLTEMIDEMEAV